MFPEATILLCTFHVIKYVKTLISTAVCTVETKNELLNNFKELLYSKSDADYEKKKKKLSSKKQTIEFRVNKKYVLLTNFQKTGTTAKTCGLFITVATFQLWATIQITRVERSFWTLKSSPRKILPLMFLVDFKTYVLRKN